MTRDEAAALLRDCVKSENLVKHCLATEAIMRALAQRLQADPEVWGQAGLLHDLDFEETKDAPERHSLKTAQLLEQQGFPPEFVKAVKAHNAEALGLRRETPLDFALASAETVTGLIVATALVQPDKKLAGVKPESVIKRMKKKDFARNVSREIILECGKLGLSLEEFVAISVRAMQGIAGQLGL